MSHFCLFNSNQSNGNLPEVNLGKTLKNTILINSNNNLLQNNGVNGQVNNIQYINQKNENIINPQINNNQNIQNGNINNRLYAKYNNGNAEIEYIQDENNNNIYDVDMNNETEFSFQEKLKEIEKNEKNNQILKINNINAEKNLTNINDKKINQSQSPISNYTLSENNGTQIINNNAENSNTNKETKVYPRTGYGNPFEKSNLNIYNFNSKQNQKNIKSKIAEISNEEKSRQYLSKLNQIPTTESHVEPNINNSNNNNDVFNNNNPIIDIPTIKSNYN
jgi:hypothetical protein